MNYEERYNELIDAIKVMMEANPHDEGIQNWVQDNVPELTESEDELTWLTKYIEEEAYNLSIDILDDEDRIKLKQLQKAIVWLEKQGESKVSAPNWCHHKVDLSAYSEEYRKAYYDGWNNCNIQHSQCNEERNDVVKCLINGMKFYYEDNEDATWGTDKWSMPVKHIIEVLEKQGCQKSVDKEFTFKSIPRLLEMIESTDRAKSYCQKLIDSLLQEGYATDAKIVGDCLKQMKGEKVAMATMDEQKPADKVEPKFNIGDHVTNGYYNCKIESMDDTTYYCSDSSFISGFDIKDQDNWKLVEYETDFKFELNFDYHVGQWIVACGKQVFLITKIDGFNITLVDTNGDEYVFDVDSLKDAHLWTIEDAKEGDVLNSRGVPFIYKKHDKNYVYFYCCINLAGELIIDTWDNNYIWDNKSRVYPATKEQRELLFAKMKEAGYEWNSKNKQLNKIES